MSTVIGGQEHQRHAGAPAYGGGLMRWITIMVAGALFAAFAGLYFWLPKWTGRMFNDTLGKWHFWLTLVSFNMIFFVQHLLGFAGMPRRLEWTHLPTPAPYHSFETPPAIR